MNLNTSKYKYNKNNFVYLYNRQFYCLDLRERYGDHCKYSILLYKLQIKYKDYYYYSRRVMFMQLWRSKKVLLRVRITEVCL